jgi:uncharacterized phage-associated protein
MDYSVFDIAHALLERSGEPQMSTVKLQKLCFYTYGWYAHQTGEGLFREQFYAMQYGPVVGELLSAHAEKTTLAATDLVSQFQQRESQPERLDPFVSEIVDAVLASYGRFGPWELVEMTHDEEVWKSAWSGRNYGRRGDLHRRDIVEHFFSGRAVAPADLHLPDSRVTVESTEFLDHLEREGTKTPDSFFDDLEAFLSTPARG